MNPAGTRRSGETVQAYKMRIWNGMTPEQRDYDRFVARSIPAGATMVAETSGGMQMQAERYRLIDEAGDADGCSCHISPPCSFCTREADEEDALARASQPKGDA